MATLDIAGFSTTVKVESVDDDGWCVVRFPSSTDPKTWWSVHVKSLAFDPTETMPAAVTTDGRLTSRQIAVLSALDKAGWNGLTDDEHESRNGLTPADVRKARAQLQGWRYVRNGGRYRPGRDGRAWVVWEITPSGEHALGVQRSRAG
jgi:hypothetical protein